MSNYRELFPDFGEVDVELPDGFVDASCEHEGCPSFQHAGSGLRIYVDYRDPTKRDNPGTGGRFLLQRLFDGEIILATDDWESVLSEVRATDFGNVTSFRT
jgi:hypothetical protein